MKKVSKKFLFKFIIFFISSYFVYLLNIHGFLNPVLSSCLVGLIASYTLQENYQAASFCGSFAGMCVLELNYLDFAIVSFFGALAFLLLTRFFNGLGGKLGMIAFVSVFIGFALIGEIL